MNIKLLRKVKRQILKEPKQFAMQELYAAAGAPADVPAHIPNCGTAACIAGWTGAILYNKKPSELTHVTDYGYGHCDYDATQAAGDLGLTVESGIRLFHLHNWPEPFRKSFRNYTNKHQWKRRAQIAADRIEHFIKTGGAE